MVSLEKGQKVRLEKQGGGTLANVRMALGWDVKSTTVTKKGLFGKTREVAIDADIDLDASAILFDTKGAKVDLVYYGQEQSKDQALNHTGDNLTGEGDGDDESILVALNRVDRKVTQIVFVVNSFSGETFDQIDNAYCRVVDSDANDTELCRYTLSGGGAVQGMVMAKLSRDGDGWTFTAIGESVAHASRIRDLEPAAKAAL